MTHNPGSDRMKAELEIPTTDGWCYHTSYAMLSVFGGFEDEALKNISKCKNMSILQLSENNVFDRGGVDSDFSYPKSEKYKYNPD